MNLRFAIGLAATLLVSHSMAAAPEYDVRNALRPGAKAPHCPAHGDTPDGCTFHTETNRAVHARLPVIADTSWVAQSPDAELLLIRAGGDETTANGARYQVIEIVPNEPQDADITVTFDRLTTGDTPVRVVERRRVSIMKHSAKSWNE